MNFDYLRKKTQEEPKI